MEEKLKAIKMIHIALILGLVLAYFFLGDLQNLNFLKFPKVDSSTFLYLLIPMAAIFLGTILYKQQLKNAERKLPIEEKVGIYQTASLIRWAMVEGAAFLILFLQPEFIVIGLFLIVYLIFLRPSEEGMKRDFDSVIE